MRRRIAVPAFLVCLVVGVTAGASAGGMDLGSGPLQGRIAFDHPYLDRDGTAYGYSVFVVDADGGTARNVRPGSRGFGARWSPDGRRLAFLRLGGVWVVNGDGSGERLLARVQAPAFPIWSPDGRRIAFQVGDRTGLKTRLAVVNTDGSGFRTLANADASAMWPNGEPSWSPDGDWIAFRRGGAIRVVQVDGSEQRLVSRCVGRACLDPRWSPDGRWLLFTGNEGIVIVEHPTTANRKERLLVRNATDQSWSPDGRTIVFVRDGTIQIMNANGSNRRRLTKGHSPVWSPDGKALAFVRYGGPKDASTIYTVQIDGTSERLLTHDAWVSFPDWGR